MTLDDIKNFLKVAETLNVTRASEILGISQPALSYSVKRLEREVGSELIIRLKNGVQLTKFGEEFLKRGKKLALYWEETKKIMDEDSEYQTGEFSLGVHPSVAIYSLHKFLPRFCQQYPGFKINLVHGLSRAMTEKVISWEIDLALVINPIQHPDLVIKELGKDEVTLFSRKKSQNKIIYDPQLAQSAFIMGKIKKSEFDGEIYSGNLEVIAHLANQGLGKGLLPSRVANNYPQLSPVAGAPKFNDRICLVYRKERHQNTVSQALLEGIRTADI